MLFGALLTAFLLGAAHALTPGHGKTIVAAYLVGSRGSVMDAVLLGAVVTLTHTASVYLLGLIFYFAADRLPRHYNEWLTGISGLLVMGMGIWIFRMRGGGHGHGHGSGHEHGHEHGHGHPHEHGYDYDNDNEQGGRVSRWSLTSLGISGGLVPCPDAILVLILALYLKRLVWGLVVIVAFSLGMAAVLIGIGVTMVLTKNAMERMARGGGFADRHPRLSGAGARLLSRLPAVSALVVAILGAGIVLSALIQAGVVRIYLYL